MTLHLVFKGLWREWCRIPGARTFMDDMTRLLTNWPAAIPSAGTVVTAHGESIPFHDFMLTDELVLLFRPQPDSFGTRQIIMKISDIIGIRIADTIEPERFTVMGFQKHTAAAVRRPG